MNTSNITNYKPKDFSELLGVSVKTLQRWDREGTLKANRTPTNRRYYTYAQYLQFKGINIGNDKRQVVIYARVSTRNQKDDLLNQVAFLRQFCNAKGIIVDQCIEEYGSGLNYNRKKWNELLDEVMEQKIKTIIVTHKDRFIRFGYDWFEKFCTKFNTTIVVVNNEELSPQEEIDEQDDNILQGMRFLCAEDNELNAEILTELLKIEGAECTICENGEEILKTFEKSAPGDYDMILMDVQMPVMNGYEATKAIRRSSHELAKKIPIIAMTANAFSEDIQHSLAAGMNAHVSKPVEMRVLEKTIRSIKTGGGAKLKALINNR